MGRCSRSGMSAFRKVIAPDLSAQAATATNDQLGTSKPRAEQRAAAERYFQRAPLHSGETQRYQRPSDADAQLRNMPDQRASRRVVHGPGEGSMSMERETQLHTSH